ncbi:hypothetical protein OAG20_01305 [Verrucomicrobiales bacterium]|jgi:hypothetical protein|nr:hypothetical protein [Verrucomicrobiales bacterium]
MGFSQVGRVHAGEVRGVYAVSIWAGHGHVRGQDDGGKARVLSWIRRRMLQRQEKCALERVASWIGWYNLD